jgi:hypothetical protein
MAVGGKKCNQEDQGAGQQGSQAGSIQPGEWLLRCGLNRFLHHHNQPTIELIQ